jgi:hypothetical protein
MIGISWLLFGMVPHPEQDVVVSAVAESLAEFREPTKIPRTTKNSANHQKRTSRTRHIIGFLPQCGTPSPS